MAINRTNIQRQMVGDLGGFVGRDVWKQLMGKPKKLYAEGDTVEVESEETITKTFPNGKTWTWNPSIESEPDPETGRTRKFDRGTGKMIGSEAGMTEQISGLGGINLFGQATLGKAQEEAAAAQRVPVSVSIVPDSGDPVDKPYSGYTGAKNVEDLFSRMKQTKLAKQIPIIGTGVKIVDYLQGGEKGAIERHVEDAGYGIRSRDKKDEETDEISEKGKTVAELLTQEYTGNEKKKTKEEKKKEEERSGLQKGVDFLGKIFTGGFGDTSLTKGKEEQAKAHMLNLMAGQPSIGDTSRRPEEGYNWASTYGIEGPIPSMNYEPNYDIQALYDFTHPSEYKEAAKDWSAHGKGDIYDVVGLTAEDYGFGPGDWGVGDDSLIASGGPIPFAQGGGLSSLANKNLAPGSFVLSADVISGLGDGSSESGLRRLNTELGFPITPNGVEGRAYGGTISGTVRGPGSGLDDLNQTTIAGKQAAALANQEVVVSPGSVTRLAQILYPDKNMSTQDALKSGQEALYNFQKNIRKQKADSSKGGKQPGPLKTGKGGLRDLMMAG